MTTLGSASATCTTAPAAVFARWSDMATWPEWNADTEWVRLHGPFVEGATGVLKPKGGPKVKFVVATLTDTDFVDVSKLLGARLTFSHHIVPTPQGCRIDVEATLTGLLAPVWDIVLGKGIRTSLQRDLDLLVTTAQTDVAQSMS